MKSRACMLSVTALTLGSALAFATSSMAADLPQSGSFKIHSAFKGNDQMAQIGDKHFMGSGNAWAVTYNDAGSGLLHMGAALCAYTLDDMNGSFAISGRCAWGDADGDKIFTEWTGKGTDGVGNEGLNTITGGTGKFAGIQGQAPFQCKFLSPPQGPAACTQQFEYRLAATAANR
jgi:hypothetical protein